MKSIDIYADIKGIKYTPQLCGELTTAGLDRLGETLSKKAAFLLKVDSGNQIALSRWVSPKRTRSYPYGRVYDTLQFTGKKVTVIPIFKDEGKEGDRDFVQWDTISLMSLLGIHVIIGYYSSASRSPKYKHKVTAQNFDLEHLNVEIGELLCYQSDALHWNLAQIDKIGDIGKRALKAYTDMAEQLNVEMHSLKSAEQRIKKLLEGRSEFMTTSRNLAKKAQARERATVQPKEHLAGMKGTLTIKNYLGGHYYWTCDEVKLCGNRIHLIEAKHTTEKRLPALGDIKDALLKMMLFTNLENVKVDGTTYRPVPIVKLTTGGVPEVNDNKVMNLREEAQLNCFRVSIDGEWITDW